MSLEGNLIQLKEKKKEVLEGFHTFLENICETLPFNITLYEEKGMCISEAESCKYSQFVKRKGYLCKKKAYTLSKETKFQFF